MLDRIDAALGPDISWFPDWSNETCAIIASGPSACVEDAELLKGKCRVAVVNNGFQLAPWADALYACDARWWNNYPEARKFSGLKISRDPNICDYFGIKRVDLIDEKDSDENRISMRRMGTIGRGGNSGFQLINLVTQFGCRKQIWIGFDFCGDHWHGKHSRGMANPRPHTLARWAKTLDEQAPLLNSLGVLIANCSKKTALNAYEKMPLAAAIERFL